MVFIITITVLLFSVLNLYVSLTQFVKTLRIPRDSQKRQKWPNLASFESSHDSTLRRRSSGPLSGPSILREVGVFIVSPPPSVIRRGKIKFGYWPYPKDHTRDGLFLLDLNCDESMAKGTKVALECSLDSTLKEGKMKELLYDVAASEKDCVSP